MLMLYEERESGRERGGKVAAGPDTAHFIIFAATWQADNATNCPVGLISIGCKWKMYGNLLLYIEEDIFNEE